MLPALIWDGLYFVKPAGAEQQRRAAFRRTTIQHRDVVYHLKACWRSMSTANHDRRGLTGFMASNEEHGIRNPAVFPRPDLYLYLGRTATKGRSRSVAHLSHSAAERSLNTP